VNEDDINISCASKSISYDLELSSK